MTESNQSDQTASARLSLVNISKQYPGVLANDTVSLSVNAGEVHGLIGENGAGKSTLMKIAYGLVTPDSGQIFWDGKAVTLDSPANARALGIGMVFQHFSLFESLTVAENVALVLPGERGERQLAQRIESVGERYGLPIDPQRYVHDLSVGERQRVEIIRCLLLSPKLLILDEPTSVLTPQAAEGLFETLRRLSDDGMSVLYISHKLDEVRRLCDRATVLRDGKVTGTCEPSKETVASLSEMMLGQLPPDIKASGTKNEDGLPILTVRNLHCDGIDNNERRIEVDALTVSAGQVVGIAGISGNGQNELMNLLTGERIVDSLMREDCEINILDNDVRALNVQRRRKLGLAFVPEERLGRGAVPPMGLDWNMLLTLDSTELVRGGLVDRRALRRLGREVIERFQVKASGERALADGLSGGNLQKYIVGRELSKQPALVIVAQPTWGVDVGAAAKIRQALVDLAASGSAVLVVSEDLEELLQVCHTLYVIADGRLSAPLEPSETSIEKIGMLMGGAPLNDVQSEAAQ